MLITTMAYIVRIIALPFLYVQACVLWQITDVGGEVSTREANDTVIVATRA
jgi:hypothetical protein